jgi:lysophospholipase L1-like esterase
MCSWKNTVSVAFFAFVAVLSASATKAEATSPSCPHALELLRTGSPVRIICFGDSITAVYWHSGGYRAYPEILKQYLCDEFNHSQHVEVVNAGVSGNTTIDGLARMEQDVLRHAPNLIIVKFGMNDIARAPHDVFRDNLRTIIRKGKEAGAEVLVCTPNDIVDSPARSREKLMQYASTIRAVCAETNAPLCELFADFEQLRTTDPAQFEYAMSDAIHPNFAGQILIAKAIAKSIGASDLGDRELKRRNPLSHTMEKLTRNEAIRVVAAAPNDELIEKALATAYPDSKVEMLTWETQGKSFETVLEDAAFIRQARPDLVIFSLPPELPKSGVTKAYKNGLQLLSTCMTGGRQEWDVIALAPSTTSTSNDATEVSEQALARIARAYDLELVRPTSEGNQHPVEFLAAWIRRQAP